MARLLTKGWGALKDRGERARVRALLYGMEDRELKDLGFTRSEIESVTVIAWGQSRSGNRVLQLAAVQGAATLA
jgi:uncharacterized protein YjiS (DUF1127 family)